MPQQLSALLPAMLLGAESESSALLGCLLREAVPGCAGALQDV